MKGWASAGTELKRKAAEALDTPEKQASQRAATYDAKVQKLQIDLEAIECTVCLEVILPPMKMCANSHIMCTQCTDKCSSRCPQCREEVSLRNRALEKTVEKLVVPCRYKAAGCPAEFLGATVHQSCLQAAQHAEGCVHAPLRRCPCLWDECLMDDPQGILDLKQHLLGAKHHFKDKGDITGRWHSLSSDGGIKPGGTWALLARIRDEHIVIHVWLESDDVVKVNLFRLKSAASARFAIRAEFASQREYDPNVTRVVVELPNLPNARDNRVKHVLMLPTSLFGANALPDSPQRVSMHLRLQ